jgi:RND family efflux transporter MFP subunit
MNTNDTRKTRLKPAAWIAIAIAAAVAALLFFMSRGPGEADKPAPPKAALTVTTATPSAASLPIRLAANGNVAAWQEAVIGSEAGGLRLTEVRVNVGDIVKRGEVLAVFSADSVNADLNQARAALAEAQAAAAEAAANASRARSIEASGALSAQQISQYVTAEQTANARIAGARASLVAQQVRLKYTRVLAPDDGVISARNATVGSVVGVGTELFRMIRQGRLEWRAEVTANELARIRPGMVARVTGAAGSAIGGKVRTVAPTIDAQARTALVYVDLPAIKGANPPFRPGMFASGQFDLGTSKAMTVPQQAVAVRDGFSYVFRLNPDSRVSQVKVSTGRRLGERVEITAGLAPDAQVVVSGAGFLNDGDLVRKVAPTATQAAR